MVDKPGFILLGAGLPRTGTLSTRTALQILLNGPSYHMATVISERPEHQATWIKACKRNLSPDEWRELLVDFKSGVDYPISFFYKEILEAFPDVKVLLNVREPEKWYVSVRDSIFRMQDTQTKFPGSFFSMIMGLGNSFFKAFSERVPSCSTITMMEAISEGKDASVQFYNEHVDEVMRVVPADRLLLFRVQEGWEPLCRFLDLPVPDLPFPNVNDTKEIQRGIQQIQTTSRLTVLYLPLALILVWLLLDVNPLLLLLLYSAVMAGMRVLVKAKMAAHMSGDRKKK